MDENKSPFVWYGEFEINGILYDVMELADYSVDASGKLFPQKWDQDQTRWIILTEEEKLIAKRM